MEFSPQLLQLPVRVVRNAMQPQLYFEESGGVSIGLSLQALQVFVVKKSSYY